MKKESWPDIINYVSPEPREPRPGEPETIWVVTSPEMMYEKSKEHLLGRLRNPNPPDGVLAVYYNTAKSLNPKIWDNLKISTSVKSLDPNFRVVRFIALDTLRLWFTEHLARVLDIGENRRLGFHIGPRDMRYKD